MSLPLAVSPVGDMNLNPENDLNNWSVQQAACHHLGNLFLNPYFDLKDVQELAGKMLVELESRVQIPEEWIKVRLSRRSCLRHFLLFSRLWLFTNCLPRLVILRLRNRKPGRNSRRRRRGIFRFSLLCGGMALLGNP